MNSQLVEFVRQLSPEAAALSQQLFHTPEIADTEVTAASALSAFLAGYGFCSQIGLYHTPTSFVSVWGEPTHPCIGFIAEYDALPGLDQPGGCAVYQGNAAKPGHGCGHNLLGTACVLAAAALKRYAETHGLPVRIIVYGCPAEEILKGKIEMAHHGAFRDLDLALSWHPFDSNRTSNTACQAMDSLIFTFHGVSAHAAAAPHRGRSALDACELMNVGVNYLREHLTDGERIHYVYQDGGITPNVVPEMASTRYFIRGKNRALVSDTCRRVLAVAKGAAIMTETTMEYSFQSRGYEMLVNHTIAQVLYEIMNNLPLPEYTEEELKFARDLSRAVGCAPEYADTIDPYIYGQTVQAFGSTDFSDVSHLVPAGAFRCACAPRGTPLHHWAMTACSGSSVGIKGMIYAAQVLAEAGLRFATDPVLLQKAKNEFDQLSNGWW